MDNTKFVDTVSQSILTDIEYETPAKADLTVDLTKMTVPEIVHGMFLTTSHSQEFALTYQYLLTAIILLLETQSLV